MPKRFRCWRGSLGSLNPNTLRRVIRTVRPDWEDEMLSIAAEGRAGGRAYVPLCPPRRRFAPWPDDLGPGVRGADAECLDRRTDRFLNAGTLADVFRPALPH